MTKYSHEERSLDIPMSSENLAFKNRIRALPLKIPPTLVGSIRIAKVRRETHVASQSRCVSRLPFYFAGTIKAVASEVSMATFNTSTKDVFTPFGGERYPRDNTRVVLHSDCRLNRIEFKLLTTDNGLAIQHVPSEKCLQPQTKNSTENIWKLVFSANCSSAFRLLENGRLQHIVSGFCINALNQTDTNRNEDDVVLKDDCVHKETGLYGLELKAFQTFTLKSEFVLVEIKKDGNTFKEFHLQALQKPDVLKRPIKAEGLGLNVFMFMLDSTSAAHFHRKMRRSLEYLQNQVNTIFFKGEGIVGDGTTAQLSAMLTGIAEEHQNEARRGKPGAKSVDDWNWIYKDFKNHGYATLLSEDDPDISTFNFRLLGYNEPPTDHYARPFWIALNKQNTGEDPSFCFGPQPIHNLSFSYVRSFCDAYPRQPKFSMVILSYLTHQYFNALSYADEDMVNLLQHLEKNGHMNNSLVIIFGDHGYRLSKFRETTQGKLEERLPFLSMTVPPWFPRKHPEVYGNLKHNSDVLTSPFDVYATLRHLLSYPLQPRDIVTGQSLFNRIDKKKRTCADAGIDTHWCPCMQWEKIDTDQELVPIIADSILTHINNLTSSSEQLRQLCRPLELKTIQAVWKEAPNKKVQRFKKTKKVRKCDSCVPVYGDKSYDTLTKDTMYQMQFVVEPGPAVFEASVRMIKGLPRVDSNYISRINAYVGLLTFIENRSKRFLTG
ncbi:hypothetical protein QZH41_002169 [Actinostola sp. cb2023]|nr:hypothetical protein QZH41_002169 [Actinostola sp. cb2023]